MADPHRHVDLDVLHLVERLLRPDDHEPSPAPATDEEELAPVTQLARSRSTSHPAAHVPGRPLIATEPVTHLPRQR
jgi:hypothetical protein